MLKTEIAEVLAELGKLDRRRRELWCEEDDMIRAKKRGCPPSFEEIQDYRTRKKEAEADYQSLIERLRKIKQSESKQNEPKHTPKRGRDTNGNMCNSNWKMF